MAGPGFGAIAGVDNYQVKHGNGLGPRTRIVSLSKSNMTQAELEAAITFMTLGGTAGTDDAVVVAGITSDGGDAGGTAFVPGESDVVHVAVQGTGAMTAGADYGVGSTGVTMAIVADFDQNPA